MSIVIAYPVIESVSKEDAITAMGRLPKEAKLFLVDNDLFVSDAAAMNALALVHGAAPGELEKLRKSLSMFDARVRPDMFAAMIKTIASKL